MEEEQEERNGPEFSTGYWVNSSYIRKNLYFFVLNSLTDWEFVSNKATNLASNENTDGKI